MDGWMDDQSYLDSSTSHFRPVPSTQHHGFIMLEGIICDWVK